MPSDTPARNRFKLELMLKALEMTQGAFASSQGGVASAWAYSSYDGSLGAVKCVLGGDFNMTAKQVHAGMDSSKGRWELSDDSPDCNRDFLFCSQGIRKVAFLHDDGAPIEYLNFEQVHKLVGGELDVKTGAATSTLASPQGVVATGVVATGAVMGVVATSALAPSQGALAKASSIVDFIHAKKTEIIAEIVDAAQAREQRMEVLREAERQEAARIFERARSSNAAERIKEAKDRLDKLTADKAAVTAEADKKLRAATLQKQNVDELMHDVNERKRKAQELEQQEDEARVIAEGASASSRGTAQEAGVMAGVSASSQGYDVMAGAGTFAPPQGAASPAQQVTVEEFVPDYTAYHEEEEKAVNDVSSVTMTMPSVMKIPKREGRDGYVWSQQGAVEFIAKVLDCRCVVGVDMNLCDTAGFPPGTCVSLAVQKEVQRRLFTLWCEENPDNVAENNSCGARRIQTKWPRTTAVSIPTRSELETCEAATDVP